MYCIIYINVLIYQHYTQILYLKKEISIQICKVGNAKNANEAMLAGYADPDASYPDADPNAT